MGVLFAATRKRAKYDSAPSTLPIGPLLSRKQDKCAYFSASCGGERCVYVRLLGADSKNFEKGSPLSFFSVGWGRVWQRLCVCVCVCARRFVWIVFPFLRAKRPNQKI